METNLWEEKNLTEQEKKLENKTESEDYCSTIKTKSDLTKNALKDIIEIKSGIYKIINKVNGKYYIGSSKDICDRLYGHLISLINNAHPNDYLQKSWNKHGEANFGFEIVKEIKPLKEELLKAEQVYLTIAKKEQPKCYNLNFLANGGEISEYSKRKISAAAKSRKYKPLTNDHKIKLSTLLSGKNNPNFGKTHSAEARAKISKSATGNKRWLGKKHKPETIEKLRIIGSQRDSVWIGRKHTTESRMKMSVSQKGRVTSDKTKDLLSSQRKGNKNPKFDNTIYSWSNVITGEEFTGHRFDFRKKFNVSSDSDKSLIKGHHNQTRSGWVLIKKQ